MPEHMNTAQQPRERIDGFDALAAEMAGGARAFIQTCQEVAAGADSERALPLLLLASGQVFAVGAALGAVSDIVPHDRFETDAGPDEDVEPLRSALADLFHGIDEYGDVVDPMVDPQPVTSRVSDDLAEITAALLHGLSHYEDGRVSEALWWWQFSFLASWGERAAQASRALVSILGHVRLDADLDVVLDAKADALFPGDDDPAGQTGAEPSTDA